jgi:hypothetical protein
MGFVCGPGAQGYGEGVEGHYGRDGGAEGEADAGKVWALLLALPLALTGAAGLD